MTTKLKRMVSTKLSQWASESEIHAATVILHGGNATLIEYPTGLRMMKFGEGVLDEVPPDTWTRLWDKFGPCWNCGMPYNHNTNHSCPSCGAYYKQ